jgi:replicative DNA helicase
MAEREPLRFDVFEGGRASRASAEPRTHDLDVEASVVGNAIYQSDLAADLVARARPHMFASEAHRRIAETVAALCERSAPVDVVAVATELRATGRLEQVGGMPYLTELASRIPVLVPSHVLAHAQRVRDLWVRRELRDLGRLATSRSESDSADTATLLAEVHNKLDVLVETLTATEAAARLDVIADQALAEIIEATDTPGRGVCPTGFEALDRLTSGLPRDLAVLCALPGEGKTSLATAIAVNVARSGGAVLLASLETPREQLVKRVIAAEARLDVRRTIAGSLTRAELPRFLDATRAIRDLPIYVEDDATTVRELFAKCRSLQLAMPRDGRELALVVVDYLQLMRPPTRRTNRHEEVADVARALKNMAVELGVPVLALSQLNAAKVEGHADKRPRAGDLAESGEIRKCARLILALHRPDEHAEDKRNASGIAEVWIRKNNNGPSNGMARLHFAAPSTRFSNLPEDEPPIPHAADCRCLTCADRSLFPAGYEP